MNSRFSIPPKFNENITYKNNPDKVINANGRSLLRILKEEKSFHILNGLQYGDLECDTDFTFFKGELCSQNDVALTNCVDMITGFQILDKSILSDHKPISVSLSMKPKTQLELVASCAMDTLKYDHYDVNKKVLQTVRLSQLDVPECINAMNVAAKELKELMEKETLSNNEMCARLTNVIYSSCRANKRQNVADPQPVLKNQNCTSRHYAAIAEANFKMYNQLLLEGKTETDYVGYLRTWLEADKLAKTYNKEEMNIRVNERWNSCKVNDGRSLWKAIDWKGKSINENLRKYQPM